MTEKTVTYKTDFSDMPALTEKERSELKALADLSEDEIDTSDIAPLDESFWKAAKHGNFISHRKLTFIH